MYIECSIFAVETITKTGKEISKMTIKTALKPFGFALSGVIFRDSYLERSTGGEIPNLVGRVHFITVKESKRNMRNDFKFISSDLRKATDAARIKLTAK
jgi:hypothetical protein